MKLPPACQGRMTRAVPDSAGMMRSRQAGSEDEAKSQHLVGDLGSGNDIYIAVSSAQTSSQELKACSTRPHHHKGHIPEKASFSHATNCAVSASHLTPYA